MPIYEYRCSQCGRIAEEVRPLGTDLSSCPACGAVSERRFSSTGVGIVGPTTDSRGMFRRYQEASAEIDYAASKHEANTGQPARVPDYWGAAKKQAAAIERAGESPLPRKDT